MLLFSIGFTAIVRADLKDNSSQYSWAEFAALPVFISHFNKLTVLS